MENNNNNPQGKRNRAYSKIDLSKRQTKKDDAEQQRAQNKDKQDTQNKQNQPSKQITQGKPAQQQKQTQANAGDTRARNRNRAKPSVQPKQAAPNSHASASARVPNEVRNSEAKRSGNGASASARGLNETKRNTTERGRRGKKNAGNQNQPTVKITPLGGIEEIGKNMTLFECDGDMIIVDCGMGFPDSDLYGIDVVIPDFTYAVENQERIKGLLITHGHEDHIGAIPYFLKQMNVPIYGTKLTIGLIEAKLREHGMLSKAKLNVITAGQKLQFGCFKVEPVRVNHSIPDAVAFAIGTPVGMIVHTGDFKIDFTPILDDVVDLRRFGELGSEGVLLLMADSTNAEKPGGSVSERVVGDGFEALFSRAEGKRIVIATFASNVQRVQQIIDLAERHGRKLAISGRSMENYSEMALKLGYLKLRDPGILIDVSDVNRYRPEDVIIVTTGSQGEPMSALSRMANGTHKQISISSNDFVIISASPIPGNEKTVTKVINELLKLGSDVIYESMYEVHASGHACRDDLKLMFSILKPKYFVPVHGEYKHLIRHREIALMMGVESQNVLIPAIGQTMEVSAGAIRYGATVPSGRVLVDGLGVGDVGTAVLRDRKHLSEEGLMVIVVSLNAETNELISDPDIISKGFVFVRDAEELMNEAKALVREIVERRDGRKFKKDRSDIKLEIREEVGRLMYQRTKRNPMILPFVMEI